MALPRALQHRPGAAHHRLAAPPRLVSRYEQEAELKAIRAELPEYAAIHSHFLQDVLARLDKTYRRSFVASRAGREGGVPTVPGA